MNPLLRKEIRLLLPSFVTALLLVFAACLLPSGPGTLAWRPLLAVCLFVLCPVMAVVTALDSFGREISAGTLSGLLAQPIPRSRIWWTKTGVLALAFAVLTVAWWGALYLHAFVRWFAPDSRDLAIATITFVPAVFSGALWTMLLLRQGAAAFWLTLLIPGALLMIVLKITQRHPDSTDPLLIGAFLAYTLAGFLLARRLFLGAQDAHWTGGTIALPQVPGWRAWWVRRGARRPLPARAALLLKELQLHQSQLLIAGALALLHLGAILARNLAGPAEAPSTLDFLLHHFWIFWLVLPLLLGCAAVAEERKLGTLEAQLCLPVKRRTQFLLKLMVVLCAALAFGVIAPVLLEGRKILPENTFNVKTLLENYQFQVEEGNILPALYTLLVRLLVKLEPLIRFLLPFTPLLLLSGSLAVLSFYASTLTRSTLQALAPAISGVILTWVLLAGASQIEVLFYPPPWRGPLIYVLGIPVLTISLGWLTYWNFKRVLVGWAIWRRNLSVFLGALALVIVCTTALYHRVWELVTPLEPPHGPARWSSPGAASLRQDGSTLVIRLPDGRTFIERILPEAPDLWATLSGDWTATPVFGLRRYLEGTNYTSVTACYLDVVAVKQDGSLWASEKPEAHGSHWRPKHNAGGGPIPLVRIGQDNDWKAVAGAYQPAFLLKTDGTLWRLGTNRIHDIKRWPGLRTFLPERLGTLSNWADIAFHDRQLVFRQTDGRAWVKAYDARTKREHITLDDQTVLGRAPQYDDLAWRSRVTCNPARRLPFQAGVREDGSLRVCAMFHWRSEAPHSGWHWVVQDARLGTATNWLAVTGDHDLLVALKADGSLWRWHFPDDPARRLDTAYATRLGSHSDWLAICAYAGGLTALAADGSLWYWQTEPRDFYPSPLTLHPLLAASRKPQRLGSVLDQAE